MRNRRNLILSTAAIVGLALAVLAGLITAPRLEAQSAIATADQPKFDVASVKPHKSGDLGQNGNLGQAGGRVVLTNLTLRSLIGAAYGLPGGPFFRDAEQGTPSWADSEHFDIEAEAEGNPSRDEKLLMLQSLLADRFKLAAHHETRQLPVFKFTVAKAGKMGPQLQLHTDASKCFDPALGGTITSGPNDPLPMPCGNFRTGFYGPTIRTAGGNVTLQVLAKALSYLPGVDRSVVDDTGITEHFDIRLEWGVPQTSPAESEAGGPPSISTALQGQLGLKLVSTTGPVDVLVIDHVEEPSPN
jgi:uncharacterized protein (TIGR03435 family)